MKKISLSSVCIAFAIISCTKNNTVANGSSSNAEKSISVAPGVPIITSGGDVVSSGGTHVVPYNNDGSQYTAFGLVFSNFIYPITKPVLTANVIPFYYPSFSGLTGVSGGNTVLEYALNGPYMIVLMPKELSPISLTPKQVQDLSGFYTSWKNNISDSASYISILPGPDTTNKAVVTPPTTKTISYPTLPPSIQADFNVEQFTFILDPASPSYVSMLSGVIVQNSSPTLPSVE